MLFGPWSSRRKTSGKLLTRQGEDNPFANDGLVSAFATFAWFFFRRAGGTLDWIFGSIALSIGFIFLCRFFSGTTFARRFGSGFARLAMLCLIIPAADRAMAAWETRSPVFTLFAWVVAQVLGSVGFSTDVSLGMLGVNHPDGLVSILPSMEKVGIRLLADCLVAWAALRLTRTRPPSLRGIGRASAILLGIGLVRFLTIVGIYLENDDILVGSAGLKALDLFENAWITFAFLLLWGWLTDRTTRELSLDRGSPNIRNQIVRRRALAAAGSLFCLGFVTAFSWMFSPPGREKEGRVLIDDRFCGIWEPTARLLDENWFGDFPTYSFSSLAEWLGHWFVVDVNTSKPYDDALLSRYDVLIIKTPVEPIPKAERDAIDRFMLAGGGVLLVGDHTNLLGMGTHLNSICAKHGISFRYDSVSDGATGGFVSCVNPMIGRHVASLHVKTLEFMTSCSVNVSPNAETVLAAEGCMREPHDYAASSFFGRHGAQPSLERVRTVLCAATRVGEGKLVAFTDSTVWSSFAVFQSDREKLALDVVRYLNRSPNRFEKALGVLKIVLLIISIVVGVSLLRVGMTFPVLIFCPLGVWLGLAACDLAHQNLYAWPEPRAAIAEATFVWKGGGCAFPPVLGSSGSLPPDQAYDTLLVATQRVGLVPRIAYTFDVDLLSNKTRVVFLIAPIDPPPARTLTRLERFVNSGGSLILFDDSRFDPRGAAKDYLGAFGVSIIHHKEQDKEGNMHPHVHLSGDLSTINSPDPDLFVALKNHGKGSIVYARDAASFSRKGLGHCFARPWRSAKSRYEVIYFLLRDSLGVTPRDRRFYKII